MFSQFGGCGWWGHPQLTTAQQQANQQVDASRRALDSQIESWSSQCEAAAMAGTASAPSPPAIGTAYSALLAALAAKKTADGAAAAPTPTTSGAGSGTGAVQAAAA
jgi:hypothetical protein